MANPILTLTTDFGLKDHYVGVMKGIILGMCPEARIVDISHSVEPFNIAEAAYQVAQACSCFPPGTVHIVVVDPGVGTARRAIVAEVGSQLFVAPDNGVLSLVLERSRPVVRALTNSAYFRHPVSRTFHGRDVFAPVAAALAAGAPAEKMGPQITDFAAGGFGAPAELSSGAYRGRALHVDRFGNVVTNFSAPQFAELLRSGFALQVGAACITRLAEDYQQYGAGALFAIEGSSGYLEISASEASAAALLGCVAGAEILLRLSLTT